MEDVDLPDCNDLGPEEAALVKRIMAGLPILADVCRADLALYCRCGRDEAVSIAQAMPHSVAPLYESSRVGARVSATEASEIIDGLHARVNPRMVHTIVVRGATIARQLFPVHGSRGRLLAVMVMDSYWFAHERHRRRSKVFQDALYAFVLMVLRGELVGAESLMPFGEHDGIVWVGADRRIQYMSGVASGLYRHLGYRDNLVGRRVTDLDTVDVQMVGQAISERRCFQREDEQSGLTWVRRALPVFGPDESLGGRLRQRLSRRDSRETRLRGVLILVHDATEALAKQRELESKLALIREVHHRVKNNLQVIASLMRMQARRLSGEEARQALEDSVNRILSVAVVHEFLSQNASGMIDLQEIAHRILGQIQQGLIDPGKRVRLTVKGPSIWLLAERATQCALVINELVQNAIEHGIADRQDGSVLVELIDEGDKVSIVVSDDGQGLPEGFNLLENSSLGLTIVRSMIERDLKGTFALRGALVGTRAIVSFDKSVLGGS